MLEFGFSVIALVYALKRFSFELLFLCFLLQLFLLLSRIKRENGLVRDVHCRWAPLHRS
jgi:hypothetical protein